jgi:O-acetyl-ADP-ribose deacetylase (regulator of RNase III)
MKLSSTFILIFTTISLLACSKGKVMNNLIQRVNENNNISISTTSNVSYKKIINGKLSLVYKDITEMQVGAIVNAANESLLGGGGVDGVIHKAAGPQLRQYCLDNFPEISPGSNIRCNPGDAKITPGFNLSTSYVIHTVGPIYSNYTDQIAAGLLANCYTNSLRRAQEKGIRTIAFSCISTNIFGYPRDKAAPVALRAVRNFLASNDSSFDEIIFVCYGSDGQENYKIYKALL